MKAHGGLDVGGGTDYRGVGIGVGNVVGPGIDAELGSEPHVQVGRRAHVAPLWLLLACGSHSGATGRAVLQAMSRIPRSRRDRAALRHTCPVRDEPIYAQVQRVKLRARSGDVGNSGDVHAANGPGVWDRWAPLLLLPKGECSFFPLPSSAA
jgi:hypothetical protein